MKSYYSQELISVMNLFSFAPFLKVCYYRKNLFSITFAILGIVQFNFNNPFRVFCFSLVLYMSFDSLRMISLATSIVTIICRYCVDNILPLLIRFKDEEVVSIELLSNSKPRIQQLRDKCQSYDDIPFFRILNIA